MTLLLKDVTYETCTRNLFIADTKHKSTTFYALTHTQKGYETKMKFFRTIVELFTLPYNCNKFSYKATSTL